ncbi:MAG: S8 family serine peptidase, partial [Candidatus Hodarchaeota archaeon]
MLTIITPMFYAVVSSSISQDNVSSLELQNTWIDDMYMDPELARALETSENSEILDVWLIFHDDDSKSNWLLAHSSLSYQDYEVLPGIFFSSESSTIKRLLDDDFQVLIKSAWLEREIDTKNWIASSLAPRPSDAPMDAMASMTNLTEFRNETGLDGRGTIISLLSTGIDGTHPDLKFVKNETGDPVNPKIIANVSFVDWDPIYNDLHGEGTHLAGIVGGTGDASNGTYEGIAPGAQLINAKCVDLLGITLWHWAVSAVEYSFDHGADIILVGWNIIGYPGDPLTTAINEIVKKGITVITASGSLGP